METGYILDSLEIRGVFFTLSIHHDVFIDLVNVIIPVVLKLAPVGLGWEKERKRLNAPKSDTTIAGLMKCLPRD